MPNEGLRLATIRVSREFLARLGDIERYRQKQGRLESLERMMELLERKVVPLLRRFPAIGRRFLNTPPDAYDALLACEELIEEMETAKERPEIREHVFDDYVILYVLAGDTVLLSCIRHTKEISFDFDQIWGPER